MLARDPEVSRRWFYRDLGLVLAVGGFIFLAVVIGYASDPFGASFDAHAYWLAGANLLADETLYGVTSPTGYGAFRYPPVFALALAPASLLSPLVFDWLWRLVCLGALRYLVGSWTRVGWSLWLVPVTVEVAQANVALVVGASIFAALRGQMVGALPMSVAIKAGAVMALPYVWIHHARQRRALLAGAGVLGAGSAITALLAPNAWPDYFGYLVGQAQTGDSGSALMIAPDAFSDFMVRATLGLALGILGAWRKIPALVFIGAIIAVPVLWLASLSPLVALPRLMNFRTLTEKVVRPTLQS